MQPQQQQSQLSMAEKAYYLSPESRGIRVLYKHTACEEAMEQWVRVHNERDRKALAWLRERVGDAGIAAAAAAQACTRGDSKPYLSVVCRRLGLSVPRLTSHCVSTDAVGERHLPAMNDILRSRSADPHTGR
jgi:hypothetical protein